MGTIKKTLEDWTMEPLVVELPTPLREFLESSVVKTRWPEPADFVRFLIEEAQKRWSQRVEQLVEEAIASGPATPWVKSDMDEIRQRLREKHGGKANGNAS